MMRWHKVVKPFYNLDVKNSPHIVSSLVFLHPHLQSDLLHDAHQQGVHVVVQGSAHLHILAVVRDGK